MISGYVIEYVKANGPCDVMAVLGAVGRYISSTQAIRSYEIARRANDKKNKPAFKRKCANPIAVGKRRIVKNLLGHMCDSGLLTRVSRGIYEFQRD